MDYAHLASPFAGMKPGTALVNVIRAEKIDATACPAPRSAQVPIRLSDGDLFCVRAPLLDVRQVP